VRSIQDARRAAGLDVTDRIALAVEAGDPILEALEAHRDYVSAETLATQLRTGPVPDDAFRQEAVIDGQRVTVGISPTPG
jgi:isoleucyl-tRNA synthetase